MATVEVGLASPLIGRCDMWQIDNDKVMSEILDGEAVIVDLASGRYHAAAGVAATVWEGLLCGHSFERIMDEARRAERRSADGDEA